MTKGSAVRQGVKKKNANASHSQELPNPAVKNQPADENENSRVFRKCLLLTTGLLFCGVILKLVSSDEQLFSAIRGNKTRFGQAEDIDELPCRYGGDHFTVDRRSNLSLKEFVRCYDAKR